MPAAEYRLMPAAFYVFFDARERAILLRRIRKPVIVSSRSANSAEPAGDLQKPPVIAVEEHFVLLSKE